MTGLRLLLVHFILSYLKEANFWLYLILNVNFVIDLYYYCIDKTLEILYLSLNLFFNACKFLKAHILNYK